MEIIFRYRNLATQTHKGFTEPPYHSGAINGNSQPLHPTCPWQADLFQGLRLTYPLFSITSCLMEAVGATCVVSLNSVKGRRRIQKSSHCGETFKGICHDHGEGAWRIPGANEDISWGDCEFLPSNFYFWLFTLHCRNPGDAHGGISEGKFVSRQVAEDLSEMLCCLYLVSFICLFWP